MKYLKRFETKTENELFLKQELDELQQFVDNCLAYLLDDGFEVKVYQTPEFNLVSSEYDIIYHIWLYKTNGKLLVNSNLNYFNWDEVRNYYIPLLQMLSKRYQMGNFTKWTPSIGVVRFKFDLGTNLKDYSYLDVIDDNMFTRAVKALGIGTVVKSKNKKI